MTRVGLIADVHANLPALEAAVERLEAEGVDAYACAGDLVGYGPFPDECVALVRGLRGITCVAGNHDLIALGRLDTGRCIPLARRTLEWTREHISEATRGRLPALPPILVEDGFVVAHGSLDDPQRYVRSDADAAEQLERLAGLVEAEGAGHGDDEVAGRRQGDEPRADPVAEGLAGG